MNGGIAWAEQQILRHFDEELAKLPKRDSALGKIVTLQGKVVDRIGDNLRIELLHPDQTGTGERVDLNAWEVSLIQKENL